MKRSGRWAVSLVVIGLLAVSGWRVAVNQQHKKQALQTSAAPQELPIQIAAQEVLRVKPRQLALHGALVFSSGYCSSAFLSPWDKLYTYAASKCTLSLPCSCS